MEAMAAGLPVVVAAKVSGVREAVTPGVEALLVPPEWSNDLAAAVVELALDPAQRERMGSVAGAASVLFDIQQAGDAMEDAYQAKPR